jgi:predicted O-methyltransferase YrrM
LFKKDKLLGEIMNQTKIWATEEVILPTLVALLGYEIALNPCSYEFVKYRKAFTTDDLKLALNISNAYWLHPVERTYEDSLRTYVRQQFNHYTHMIPQTGLDENKNHDVFLRTKLINKIKKIKGWLADEEAELLIEVMLRRFREFSHEPIVEIGSYHGKSTVLFGHLIKQFFPFIKLYAIDPHDGRLGAIDEGLQLVEPSYNKLKQNIQNEELSEVVEVIKNNSWNVEWEKPISFLFIDGLHDYAAVAKDFYHFSKWILKGGYVAFHDYADYFGGVKAFADELLQRGEYEKAYHVETLIVFKKK